MKTRLKHDSKMKLIEYWTARISQKDKNKWKIIKSNIQIAEVQKERRESGKKTPHHWNHSRFPRTQR